MMGMGLAHDVSMIGQFLFGSTATSSGDMASSSSGKTISFTGSGEHVAGHSQEYWIKEATKELEKYGHKTTWYDTCIKRAEECAVKTQKRQLKPLLINTTAKRHQSRFYYEYFLPVRLEGRPSCRQWWQLQLIVKFLHINSNTN